MVDVNGLSYLCHYTLYMQTKELMPGVRISNDRCLLLNDTVMVISDLHLGYESAMESEGLHLPRINTQGIRDSLHRCLHRYEPETVVILGDIKHDFRRPDHECRNEILEILELISETAEPVLVKGNHDNFLQNILSGTRFQLLDRMQAGRFHLEHGHEDGGSRPVVIGHEHPSLRIYDQIGAHVKLPCFLWAHQDQVLVIPSFSLFSGGNDISSGDNDVFMSPALQKTRADDIDVYAVSEIGLITLGALSSLQGLRL